MNRILGRSNIRLLGLVAGLILILAACTAETPLPVDPMRSPNQTRSTTLPVATNQNLPAPLVAPTPYPGRKQRPTEMTTAPVGPASTSVPINDVRLQAVEAGGGAAEDGAPVPWGLPPPVPYRTTDSSGFSTGGTATVNDAPYDSTFFKHYGLNPFIDTEDDHLSISTMGVDTAAYTVALKFVSDGYFPDPDSVRVEEFIYYFKQE